MPQLLQPGEPNPYAPIILHRPSKHRHVTAAQPARKKVETNVDMAEPPAKLPAAKRPPAAPANESDEDAAMPDEKE